jgi:peptidoglycan/xylan/chitin deacetylase (PgdA/CDA1 family)
VDSILRTLRKEGVPATFFLTGRWARPFPAEVARIARGYVLSNHTDYPSVTGCPTRRFALNCAGLTRRCAPPDAAHALVPVSHGAHTPRDIRRVNDLGYACIR